MSPEQKIKHAILLRAIAARQIEPIAVEVTADNIDALYDDANGEDYDLQDEKNGMREGEVETGLPAEYSRHYESKSVAAKMPDDSWVGWTYWFGGGKHGDPDSIDWMDDAYNLDCKEEEKLVIVQTFTLQD